MRLLSFIFLILGLMISSYLLYRHLQLSESSEPLEAGVCQTVFKADCDATLKSPLARVLGLPLAGLGVVFYGTLLVLALLPFCLGQYIEVEALLASLVLSIAGAIAGVILMVVMLVGSTPFCPLCALVHVISFSLVPVFRHLSGRSFKEIIASLASIGRLAKSNEVSSEAVALKTVGLFSAFLASVIIGQWVLIQQLLHRPPQYDVRHAIASFSLTSRIDIPVNSADPKTGPEDAEVQLVVFSDFKCAACKRFAAELKQLLASVPGKVRLVFKNFPLNSACNKSLKQELHPGACEAALMAEAARRQNMFWPFHDALFEMDLELNKQEIDQIIRDLELDVATFESDLQCDECMSKIEEDIDLGLRLGVDETPVVFVGGRRAADVRFETLRFLIMAELANRSVVKLPQKLGRHSESSPLTAELAESSIPTK